MRTFLFASLALLSLGSRLNAQDTGSALPFAVTIGGQVAVVLIMFAFISLGSARVRGQEEAVALPFGITIGGQTAVAERNGTGARIQKPVGRHAVVSIQAPGENIILNLSKTKPTGPMRQGPPAVILINGANTASLEKSIDGRPIEPGDYDLMVVADGRTASVKLTIE